MDDATTLELIKAVSAIQTDIKNLIKVQDEMRDEIKEMKNNMNNQCTDCNVKRALDAHIAQSQSVKSATWKVLTQVGTWLIALIALGVSIF